MKLILTMLLLLSLSLSYSQNTVQLSDTILPNSGATMTFYAQDSFPTEISKFIHPKHKEVLKFQMRLRSFIPDKLTLQNTEFDTVYFYSFITSTTGERSIRIIDTVSNWLPIYHLGDTIDLKFYPNNTKEFSTIPVALQSANDATVTFDVLHHYHGFSTDLQQHITIWPYMMGTTISIADSVSHRRKLAELIRLHEVVPLDTASQIYFSNYNYDKKTIEFSIEPRESKISGYKEGMYIDSSLLANDKLTILYFGGHRCGHCEEEIPKLLKLADLMNKHEFDLVTILTFQEGTKEKAYAYYMENLFPIKNQIVTLGDDILHKLKVFSYPSYIVISEKGQIIFRSDYGRKDSHEFIYSQIKDL